MIQSLNVQCKTVSPQIEQPKSVRQSLLASIFTSILVLFILFSVTVIWLTQKGASNLILDNAQEVVHALAQQSALALLTESVENASAALNQVRSFPDVVGAGLVSADGTILDWQGEAAGKDYFAQINWPTLSQEHTPLLNEQSDFWHIAHVVVLSGNTDDGAGETSLFEMSEQKLGYAIATFSKNSLFQINRDLFITISVTGLAAIIGLPLVVGWVLKRLLKPLDKLSQVMTYNHQTGRHQIAQVQGAKELQQMALSFNAMMQTLDEQEDKLRHHRDQLEAEVNIRTKELVVARDAALTSNRYKSEFLANVTHELRSPLQSIIGYVELIREEAENEGLIDIRADLDKVTRNAERLHTLINSVLDLSKIEAGRMDLRVESVCLQDILSALGEATAPLVPKNNNTFDVHNQCGNPQLRLDREKVLQILINLVSNACKFTQQGKITLRIAQTETELQFDVMDTGIGIEADKLNIIFNEFQQVDGGEARKAGGTGLGLAISRQFCTLMKGSLTVKSEVGKGSCFSLAIPIA